ncbi:MAG: hypothetical protein M1511_00690 [Deltaproteobacteria bacterium]|nr:hypothetical protein [Deltaproteobacteria bacterium]
MDFKEAREFVRSLGLNSRQEWTKYCKSEVPNKPQKPANMPDNPSTTYKDKGWSGWGDWLGIKEDE